MGHQAPLHPPCPRAPGRVPWVLAAFGLLLTACALPACMRIRLASEDYQRALAAAPSAVPGAAPASEPTAQSWRDPAAWPARLRVRGPGTGSRSGPANGFLRVVPGPLEPMSSSKDVLARLTREASEDTRFLAWGIRARARTPGGASSSGVASRLLRVRSEGQGAYLFVSPDRPLGDDYSPRRGEVYLRYVSGRVGAGAVPVGVAPDEALGLVTPVLLERTWMTYRPPTGPREASPRGVVVLIPGLFGTPEGFVNGLASRLRAQGWAVLQLAAHPSRFTQRQAFVIDVDNPGPAAALITEELEQRAAECAYAVQAGCAWVARNRPETRGAPRVIIGISGGAMVAPAVVAREPEAYSGAVLIAGSGDWLRVAVESSYASWVDSFRFAWSRRTPEGDAVAVRPTPGDVDRLDDAYRARMTLDAEHTIAALHGKPLLMVHATDDAAVPARLGDRLWRLAGKPERWEFDTGHELLFLAFSLHAGRLTEWLEREVLAGHDGQDTPRASTSPSPSPAPGATF